MSSHHATSCRSARRAFTLVELLVVIGIIALLISILLPALNRARESARRVTCSTHLQQMGQAYAMYGVENRNWLPACYDPNSETNARWWAQKLQGYLKVKVPIGTFGAQTVPPQSPPGILICPSLRGSLGQPVAANPNPHWSHIFYFQNDSWLDGAPLKDSLGNVVPTIQRYHQFREFRRSSDAILSFCFAGARWTVLADGPKTSHERARPTLFVDGHVADLEAHRDANNKPKLEELQYK